MSKTTTKASKLKLYHISCSIGAPRMIDGIPEREYRITVAGQTQMEAEHIALTMARGHFNKWFAGNPVLGKRIQIVSVEPVKENTP